MGVNRNDPIFEPEEETDSVFGDEIMTEYIEYDDEAIEFSNWMEWQFDMENMRYDHWEVFCGVLLELQRTTHSEQTLSIVSHRICSSGFLDCTECE